MSAEIAGMNASGEVEVDGAYFGGYVKASNYKENRRDRRLAINQNGKRCFVVIMRERNGRTLPHVFKSEADALTRKVALCRSNLTLRAFRIMTAVGP